MQESLASNLPSLLHLGTSGWSYEDWKGTFYPSDLAQTQRLEYYTTQFNTVEVDSTFYGIPPRSRVENWARVAPAQFEFAVKVPKVITHDKALVDCDSEMREFLAVIDSLGDRLGPILFQFPYGFKPDRLGDLITFLDALPRAERYRYVVEIRNRAWLRSKLPDMLEERALPLCLVDHPWMPRESRVTGPFVYLRFLGDQEAITEYGHTQLDRTSDLQLWAHRAQQWIDAGLPVYAFFNNHFSGFAPHDARVFAELLKDHRLRQAAS